MSPHCTHPNLRPAFLDQTLGVCCPDCQAVQGCWENMHVSEAMWDLAVPHAVEPGAVPSKLSRPDVCFLCEEPCTPGLFSEERSFRPRM